MSDDLLDRIKKLEAQVATEQGKALAAARAQAAAIREGEQIKREAQTYRDETDLVIAQASEQLKIAWIVGHTFYTFGRWATEQAIEKDTAARILHRESSLVGLISDFVKACQSNNPSLIAAAVREGSKAVAIFTANTEAVNLQQAQVLLVAASMAARSEVEHVIKLLRTPDVAGGPESAK